MTDCNTSAGSWAIETDRETVDSASADSRQGALDNTDLRHKLRRSRGENENEDHAGSCHSPLKSPTRPRRHRNVQDASKHGPRPNYTREKDGLSPLRSPLNSDQRSSRVNPGSRRRSMRNENASKKENELPKESSPSKKKYTSASPNPEDALSMDVEEQKFRRRLDLPTEEESDSEEHAGFLDPEIEEDRITMERREKQIVYGKSTESYKLYIKTVPKDERSVDRRKHPRTPVKNVRLSRRNWDAQIKAWKKHVHQWANINFPSMRVGSRPSDGEAESESSSSVRDKAEDKEEEEDNDIDLNEEEDESFLEGFELNHNFDEPSVESNSASHA